MWQKLPLSCQKILDNGDKRTDNWLLVYSPVPIICILLLLPDPYMYRAKADGKEAASQPQTHAAGLQLSKPPNSC